MTGISVKPDLEQEVVRLPIESSGTYTVPKPTGTMSQRFNEGKRKWSLVYWPSIEDMVKVMEFGEHKYSWFEDAQGFRHSGKDITPEQAKKMLLVSSGANNWKIEGGSVTEESTMESAMRHLIAMMNGEEIDPESGLPHYAHLGCNFMFLGYLRKKRLNK